MTVEISQNGLLTNNRNRFDALKYKTDTVKEYPDANFTDNNCLISYKQSHNPMMIVDDIAKGELTGFYVMRIFWNSDELASNDLEVIIVRDGVEDEPINLVGDYDYLSGGSNVIVSFSPFEKNEFIIKTGQDADKATVKLDYVQLDQIPAGTVLSLIRKGYGDEGIGQKFEEEGVIAITGNGNRERTVPITFRGTYREAPSIMVSVEGFAEMLCGFRNVTTTGMDVYLRYVENLGWTSTWNLHYWVKGNIIPPIKILTDDTG